MAEALAEVCDAIDPRNDVADSLEAVKSSVEVENVVASLFLAITVANTFAEILVEHNVITTEELVDDLRKSASALLDYADQIGNHG